MLGRFMSLLSTFICHDAMFITRLTERELLNIHVLVAHVADSEWRRFGLASVCKCGRLPSVR